MGIISDNPGHEGYLRGYVAPDPAWPETLRELGAEYGRDQKVTPIAWVAMACECGWRSPRWRPRSWWYTGEAAECPTPGTKSERCTPEWVPSTVVVSKVDREIGYVLWDEHDRQCASDPIERAREIARARVDGPPDGAGITWDDGPRTRRGKVLSTSLRDRSGKNTQVEADGERHWIDSRAIRELHK